MGKSLLQVKNYFRFNDGVWLRFDEDAEEIEWLASSDNEFYKYHFGDLVNNYNKKILDGLGLQQEVSAVLGLDYYLYRENYWLHAWGSVYPIHKGLNRFFLTKEITHKKSGIQD